MAIERDGSGAVVVWCDSCREAVVVETEAWDAWPELLMAMLQEDGWTKRNVDGEWSHYCADCSAVEAWD